jgi:hypothetical protein
VPINPEPVYIPVLKRRDPAVELVKLADVSKSERFKKDIWTFLFSQKYRAANIVTKAPVDSQDEAETDLDLLKALESQTHSKPSKSKAKPVPVDTTETSM